MNKIFDFVFPDDDVDNGYYEVYGTSRQISIMGSYSIPDQIFSKNH